MRRRPQAIRAAKALATVSLLAVALATATPSWAAAPGPTVDVEVAPGPHTVGDRIEVVLTVSVPGAADARPRFPAWGETWGEAEVFAAGPPQRVEAGGEAPDAPQTLWRQSLVLAAFRPGRIELPPREIAVPLAGEADVPPRSESVVPQAREAGRRGTARVSTPDDLALEIASVLPAAEGGEGEGAEIPPPRPPAPPRELPLGAAFWWTLAAGLGLLAALAGLAAVRRRKAAAAGTPAPHLPPLAELDRALAAARAAASPAAGLAGVSLALRRFLGRTLGFPAAESTTSEVQRQLLARHLPTGLPRRAVDLLRACDLVKFARQPAPGGAVDRWAGEAARIGREVDRHLHPPVPAADEAERRAA